MFTDEYRQLESASCRFTRPPSTQYNTDRSTTPHTTDRTSGHQLPMVNTAFIPVVNMCTSDGPIIKPVVNGYSTRNTIITPVGNAVCSYSHNIKPVPEWPSFTSFNPFVNQLDSSILGELDHSTMQVNSYANQWPSTSTSVQKYTSGGVECIQRQHNALHPDKKQRKNCPRTPYYKGNNDTTRRPPYRLVY